MQSKLISSLEKCFLDECVEDKVEYVKGSCLKEEKYRFQFCYSAKEAERRLQIKITIESELRDRISVFKVENVPVQMAHYHYKTDENYLRTTPGLYPDVLLPIPGEKKIIYPSQTLQSVLFEVDTRGLEKAGVYPITLKLYDFDGNFVEENTFTLEVIDAVLPKQTLINTQWFYCDCLMDYYRTGEFDDRHFEIIENFVKTAADHGMNMILTPVFTPPLDTLVGGERTTNQLVDITLENGAYSFDFTKLYRFVDICLKNGMKYFEIAHFFTQWGAEHCPKIMATVDGEKKKIFGWETDATSPEYRKFLEAFIPALLSALKEKGVDKNSVFHISDEPKREQLEQYRAARAMVEDLLEGYTIMDAMSDYEFYETGALTCPIPGSNHIEPFLENKVPDLWTYYCCSQAQEVSNRFIAQPSARNRVMGVQMYKYDIKGFLHWGYNFYNNRYSIANINPYIIVDGEYFAPAGDTFSVYPAGDGTALASIRLAVFHDGLQDMQAMALLESLTSKEYVVSLIDEGIEPITFKSYPHSAKWLLEMREKINMAIKENAAK